MKRFTVEKKVPIRMGFYNNLCGDVDLCNAITSARTVRFYFNDEVEETR